MSLNFCKQIEKGIEKEIEKERDVQREERLTSM